MDVSEESLEDSSGFSSSLLVSARTSLDILFQRLLCTVIFGANYRALY